MCSLSVCFYLQTVSIAPELRHPVYRIVSHQSMDCDGLLQLISQVRWDVREIMSQHSGYVDAVLNVS